MPFCHRTCRLLTQCHSHCHCDICASATLHPAQAQQQAGGLHCPFNACCLHFRKSSALCLCLNRALLLLLNSAFSIVP
jgi:hypothetical protein